MAETKNITILQGKTYAQVVRWETTPIVYKAISAITQTAPVRITATAHGLVDGWRAAVVSAKGMTQINASNPPKEAEYKAVSVIDANTIEFNEVNAADYKAYTSGGYVQYNSPASLSSVTGRMKIKDKVGGTTLASTEVADAPKNIITVTVSNPAKTITIDITATATAAITWKKGVYELEMVDGAGVVTTLLTGTVSVVQEVTT